MNKAQIFNIYEFEKKTNLVPHSINYKLTDEEFLNIIYNILDEFVGIDSYNYRISSGTDNCVQLLDTGDLIYKLYPNPTRSHLLNSSYYILKFIFSKIIDEDIFFECTTSYRSQNKLYVHIKVESNLVKNKVKLDDNFDKKKLYYKVTEQINVLEKKKIDLLKECNFKK